MNNTNKDYLINLTELDTKKVNKSKASIFKKYKILNYSKNSNNKETKNRENSSNKKDSNYSKDS
jgi:hypothetical protein